MRGPQRHIQSEIFQLAGEESEVHRDKRVAEIRMGAGNKCRVVPVAVSRASGQDDWDDDMS